ncbi:MAG: DUF1330 domain-containing protein [Nannocystaceae bacterium]
MKLRNKNSMSAFGLAALLSATALGCTAGDNDEGANDSVATEAGETQDSSDTGTGDSDGDGDGDGDADEEGVYLMASLVVEDFDSFQADYGAAVFPMIAQAGGEVMVATPQIDLLEGEYVQNWTVVVRFPSEDAANGWYDSAEYQAMIPVRQGVTDTEQSHLLFAPEFEGVDPAGLGGEFHYLIATLSVTDFEAFQNNYGAVVFPQLAEAGAEVLVGSPTVDPLEGSYDSNWTVVVQFPSESAANDWYDSEEYQSVIPERQASTDTDNSVLLFSAGFAG